MLGVLTGVSWGQCEVDKMTGEPLDTLNWEAIKFCREVGSQATTVSLPVGRTGEARHLEGAADPGCPADRFVRPAGSRPAEDNRGSYRRTTGALGALAQGSTVRLPFLFTAAPTRSPRLLPLLPAGCPGPRFLPFTRPLACVRIRSLLSHHCTFTRSWTAFLQGSLIYQSHSLFF